MSEIPVSQADLESIILSVAHSLYEKWALDDRFTEEQIEEAAQWATDDVLFVIESYMQKINETFSNKSIQNSAEIITPNFLS